MIRLLTFNTWYICGILMLPYRTSSSYVHESAIFMTTLQELCPFSSFCHTNVTLKLADENVSPSCDSCSCQPDCYLGDTCCYDVMIPPSWNVRKNCISSVVTSKVEKPKRTYYNMISSCFGKDMQGLGARNSTLCKYNHSDYRSFAPVTSQETGDIYVNEQCAHCNNVYYLVYWKLTVSRPDFKEDHSYDTVRLLQGDDIGPERSYLTYLPPEHTNPRRDLCRYDVIRQCNVTGLATVRTQYWDFCPMFNATYSVNLDSFYGNVFCYLCNQGSHAVVAKTCAPTGIQNPIGVSLTVVLDTTGLGHINNKEQERINGGCPGDQVLIQKKCRKVHCPWGQFRVGNKCDFYSTKWIGGPFTTVLKLTVRDKTNILDKSMLLNLPTEVRQLKKAPWLQRKAMKHWSIETLYKPSEDGNSIEYLVAFATYQGSTANPAKLLSILRRTLKETWLLSTSNHTFSLEVQLNPYVRYYIRHKDHFRLIYNITCDDDFAYIKVNPRPAVKKEDLLYIVYATSIGQPSVNEYLKESFLCDQIELLSEEYEWISESQLMFKVTNQTLTESQYWLNKKDKPVICVDRFHRNNGLTIIYHIKYAMIASLFCSLLTKYILI